ncbi:MAG: cytochrome c-type biogenesis protein CcmH, partial [Gammaproteobacteria bacterium]|nr:cytochrome c-type biogenesis protein CcmH [Gammaproteobacteria bacterium]
MTSLSHIVCPSIRCVFRAFFAPGLLSTTITKRESVFLWYFSWTLLCLLLIVIPGNSPNASVFEPREFTDPVQATRYKTLIEELRCLVCQNQSLADSNAELAADLRREVY